MKNKCSCQKSNKNGKCKEAPPPKKLSFTILDNFKALINYLFLFRKAYSVAPGLYFTGDKYDKKAPMLVTCNFLLTVLLLFKNLKGRNIRLLIIDTKGINVWCSAGKGQFSSEEILKVLKSYNKDILTKNENIEIILPKLSLSGVKLKLLKKNNVKPIIGPVHMEDIPDYLDMIPYKDSQHDSYKFNVKARLFTAIPSIMQFSKYLILITLIMLFSSIVFKAGFYWQMLVCLLCLTFIYILLFPFLPGKRFAVKGISLALFASMFLFYLYLTSSISIYLTMFYITILIATGIFFGLYYTGNSAVSNYSKVKQEIITFLPISFVLYVTAFIFYFIAGDIS